MPCDILGEILFELFIRYKTHQKFSYFSHDLFSEYRTAKEAKASKFTDCAILYPDCSYPKRNVNVRRRNGVNTKKNETDVENAETQTEIPDTVTKYVKNSVNSE